MAWCFIGNFEAESICPAGGATSGSTSTDRPPDDGSTRASQVCSASFFASTKPMTSGSIETDDERCSLGSRRLERLSAWVLESHNVPPVF